MDLASKVSTKQIYKWDNQALWKKKDGYEINNTFKYHVVAIDFGIKKNILRNFSNLNTRVTVVPINTSFKTIVALKPDGVFFVEWSGRSSRYI